ncbi:Abhydrolase domain-containing protein 2, partial [Frankliniella fusca]
TSDTDQTVRLNFFFYLTKTSIFYFLIYLDHPRKFTVETIVLHSLAEFTTTVRTTVVIQLASLGYLW